MAFLDDLGRTLTQVGQATAQKTKEVADMAKINAKILDSQNKVDKVYEEIGRKYVEEHAADPEEALRGLVQSALRLEDQIREYRNQLNEIKGVAKCPNCGAECDINASYCSSCGGPMPKEEDDFVVDSEIVAETVVEEVR
ncbi:MAG: zinc ribbon domain-containing protein [Lachnospiraceae bacterium]